MRVGGCHGDDRSISQQHVPSAHQIVRAIEQRCERCRTANRVRQDGAADRAPVFIPPLAVTIEPFDAIDCRGRRVEPVGDLPAAFEFTVRLQDGSMRISSSATQDKWRSGDRIMFIGGIAPPILQ